jgi:hypothetical protein
MHNRPAASEKQAGPAFVGTALRCTIHALKEDL